MQIVRCLFTLQEGHAKAGNDGGWGKVLVFVYLYLSSSSELFESSLNTFMLRVEEIRRTRAIVRRECSFPKIEAEAAILVAEWRSADGVDHSSLILFDHFPKPGLSLIQYFCSTALPLKMPCLLG